jgi:hypothetical protein
MYFYGQKNSGVSFLEDPETPIQPAIGRTQLAAYVKSLISAYSVIPVQTGIQSLQTYT